MRSSPEPAINRPRATVRGAFIEGWRRVLAAPALTLGIIAMTLATALPLALVVGHAIEDQLGASAESSRVAAGWDRSWASEFAVQASGVAHTFTYQILGFGGTLAPLSDLLEGKGVDPAVAGAVATYVALWIFLSGGVLDRLARGRPVGTGAFFSACAVHSLRFARLAVLIGAAYWAIFRWLEPVLFGALYDRLTRNLTAEPQALVVKALLYLVVLAALMMVSLVSDFTKVRIVVEDRHSALSALAAALRFIRRRPGRTLGLYLANVLAWLILARLWLQVEPAASTRDWIAFLATQAYLLARVWTKLAFMGSEVAFFQGELAHATYAARPLPRWPDSPTVEGIRNLGA